MENKIFLGLTIFKMNKYNSWGQLRIKEPVKKSFLIAQWSAPIIQRFKYKSRFEKEKHMLNHKSIFIAHEVISFLSIS